MIEPAPYPNEKERHEAVKATHLLDTPLEERFERITRSVCTLLDVPIAIFNLLDDKRQYYKSVQGLDNTNAPLKAAFCTHTLLERDMLLVPDAAKDERFHDNPFVTGELLNVGFYAGCPIRTQNGMPVGTLCAIDTKPRDMTPDQLAELRDLAATIENELKISQTNAQKNLIQQHESRTIDEFVDPVTRLWNREGILKILESEFVDAETRKVPLAVLMAQIDDGKSVKIIFGRDLLESIYRAAAKKLLQAFRIEDSIGYYGENKFLIIVPNLPGGREELAKMIGQINTLMAEDVFIANLAKKYPVKLVFGLAIFNPKKHKTAATLMAEAEKYLAG